jgi:hypothetical protein
MRTRMRPLLLVELEVFQKVDAIDHLRQLMNLASERRVRVGPNLDRWNIGAEQHRICADQPFRRLEADAGIGFAVANIVLSHSCTEHTASLSASRAARAAPYIFAIGGRGHWLRSHNPRCPISFVRQSTPVRLKGSCGQACMR